MKRQIFFFYSKVVDANGTYNTLSGYPKVYDSKLYDNDIDKALRRATGEFANTWGTMCTRDDRQLQTVILMTAEGFIIDKKNIGAIADLPDPDPVVPDPDPTPDPDDQGTNPDDPTGD